MSQEYTEDKNVRLTRLSSGRRLLEALLVLVALFALYLMAALFSFNPSDPSWSQTAWHAPIHNLGGIPGAWLADTLFFIFGVIAYLIPVIILGGCWFVWKQRDDEYRVDYFAISLRLIGVLAMVLTSCGLAAINADDIWYFASGGVIGSLLSTVLQPLLKSSGGTIALLCVWAAGLTLFTGWSWVTIAEKIGGWTLGVLTFATNHTRRDNTWQDDEYYDDEDERDNPITYTKQPERKGRLLRGALSRRQRLANKFSRTHQVRSDEVLFSGKRMDDDYGEDEVNAPAASRSSEDVLLSSYRETRHDDVAFDPLFSGQTALGDNAPHISSTEERALHTSESIASAPSATDPQTFAPAATATSVNQDDPWHDVHEESVPPQAHSDDDWLLAERKPHTDLRAMAPVEPFPLDEAPAVSVPDFQETNAEQQVEEPPKATRPPLYYFEEVEARRAREREQLAAWYQPVENPLESPYSTAVPAATVNTEKKVAAATVAADTLASSGAALGQSAAFAKPAVAAGIAAGASAGAAVESATQPIFSLASGGPRPQVKEGIGPKLPPPNRVRVPTRRELASYGIKLPSQRTAGVQQQARHAAATTLSEEEQTALEQRALAQQFAAQQQQRYGTTQSDRVLDNRAEDAATAAALSRQFAAEQRQRHLASQDATLPDTQAEDAALAAALSRQLAAQQHTHYAPEYPESEQDAASDEEAAQQALLAAQFAAQQQQRYGMDPTSSRSALESSTPQYTTAAAQYPESRAPSAMPSPAVTSASPDSRNEMSRQTVRAASAFSLDDFEFHSPMETLVDEGPAEPMFTPIAEPQAVVMPAEVPVAPPAAPAPVAKPAAQDSLIHPFLMRNGDSTPLQKPTTPLPSLDLLSPPPATVEPVDTFAMEQMARLVEARLADFRIKATVVDYSPGPVITRFELDLAPGVKAARISNLSRDLARSLSTVAVRVVEVIPGKPYVGLELPNKKRQTVYLREVLDCPKFRDNPSPLTVVLGKDIGGEPVVADLSKMPHLLVAGTTGSGKSVGVNAMILSMLYKATPDDVRFIMIDPKMLELSVYEGIPHLLTEVVTDMKDAANALRWSVNEMERRYKLMSALGVRNLAGYNERVLEAEQMGRPIPDPFWKPGDSMEVDHPMLEKLPYIVVLVDEFADLMMTVGKKVEELIARLAQKARAAGIHLVLATQRPSVDVITGLIKANIPTRIAFTVSSKIDSRTILDQGGAESLLGMGDMLYSAPNSTTPIRVHGAFVRDQEVHAVVQDWKARGRPQYITGITAADGGESGGGLEGDDELDPLFDQAVAFVVEKRKASISGVQRQFRIGYNRAARIVEQMEAQGIVSPQGSNGNREVLSPPQFE